MKRWLPSFRGLQWKLTLSYTLVTVGAILILELIVFAVQAFLPTPAPELPGFLAQALLAQSALEAAPFLERTPPDVEGLRDWLRTVAQEDELILGREEDGMRLSNVETALLAFVDLEGRVVVAVPDGQAAPGSLLQPGLSARQATVLGAAVEGPMDPSRMWSREGDGTMAVGAPIFDQDRQSLGALFLIFTTQPLGSGYFAGTMLDVFLPSVAFFTLFAGILGTLFGFLTARWLTRRLRALADVTGAWGQGDFSAFIHAPAGDEIGRLGRQLNWMAEQLQNLLQAREELAAVEERNRLARDLHDSVKQQVFAATMTLGAAEALWEQEPAAARQRVGEALALSRQAQQELARLIHELRPVELEGKGLADALRDYAERWSRQTGIMVRVAVQEEGALPLDAERACFRVVQEALANVARHSGAGRVEITLSGADGGVCLTVADDGCGFDVAPVQGRGLGLLTMRERAEALGGHLVVDSAPGRGTRVTVQCGREVETDERAD